MHKVKNQFFQKQGIGSFSGFEVLSFSLSDVSAMSMRTSSKFKLFYNLQVTKAQSILFLFSLLCL